MTGDVSGSSLKLDLDCVASILNCTVPRNVTSGDVLSVPGHLVNVTDGKNVYLRVFFLKRSWLTAHLFAGSLGHTILIFGCIHDDIPRVERAATRAFPRAIQKFLLYKCGRVTLFRFS